MRQHASRVHAIGNAAAAITIAIAISINVNSIVITITITITITISLVISIIIGISISINHQHYHHRGENDGVGREKSRYDDSAPVISVTMLESASKELEAGMAKSSIFFSSKLTWPSQ
jgi:MFS superfamily sulfate permease-like transporter